MIRAIAHESGGVRHGLIDDEVRLDFDARHRRRVAMAGARGTEFLLDLPKPVRLRHGDVVRLEDGRRIRIVAAPEPLAEITCTDVRHLVRIAWHLGNRHLPTMLEGERLLIRRDHVIEDMVRGLGAAVGHVDAPFDPEGGAYAAGGPGHHHHHHHLDEDGHNHAPGHPQAHSHDHDHGHDPTHG